MPESEINIVEPKIDTTPPPERLSRRRYIFILVLFLSISLLGYKIWTAPQPAVLGNNILAPEPHPWLAAVKQFFFKTNPNLKGFSDDRINILILGIGGPGHEGPYLSDTNIIASIEPSTKTAALISVPRDLGVPVKNYGWRKINSASAFGEVERPGAGGDYAREVFADTFKINLPYYIRIDFTAFQEIIDAAGGIDINVPKSFTDTTFPGENYSYRVVHFDAGPQTMNGAQALVYARSRHGDNGEGSDFARSRRQEAVLTALKQKVLSLGTLANPAKLESMYTALTSHVTTNLSFDQLTYLAALALDIKPPLTLVFDSSPNGYLVNATGENGAFILSPKTGNFDAMTAAIQNIFSPSSTTAVASAPEPTLPNATKTARLEIQNGTWRVGLAAAWQQKMIAAGFPVIRVGNSLKRPLDKTVIYVINPKTPPNDIKVASQLVHAPFSTVLPDWLKERYDNPATPESEQGMKYNTDADLLIMLGTDAK